jgi:hypothetical protein
MAPNVAVITENLNISNASLQNSEVNRKYKSIVALVHPVNDESLEFAFVEDLRGDPEYG